MQEPRRPEYNLVLATKDQNSSGKRSYTTVGVAWSIFDGEGLTIKLNPGTVLDWRMTDEFYLSLLKNNTKDVRKEPNQHQAQVDKYPGYDDDIPF